MEIPDKLSKGDCTLLARTIFSASQGILYNTKKEFEDIAIDVDPGNVPTIETGSREGYIYEVLMELPFNSAVNFAAKVIEDWNEICDTSEYTTDEKLTGKKKIQATVSRINKKLGDYGIRIEPNGEIKSRRSMEELAIIQEEVFDALGRWRVGDVKNLLENAQSHYIEGKSNNLRYDDCASNAAKALEGILRKALVEAHLAKGHPDPTPKLRTMMGTAINELDNLGFWKDPSIKNATDNYREFLRNKSQHYNTETLDIKMVGFDRVTAFFALYEAITLIGTIIETMDEL